MSTTRRFTQFIFSTIIILSLSLSVSQPQPASAQGGDGIQRQVNAETGRVSFIGPESGRLLSASRALGSFARPADPALALAKRFAPEFGLKNPERDLTEMKANHPGDGRMTVRYQQSYDGVPVMGGELIVNTNENGDLYSMNGEVSPNLSLSTAPTINSETAKQTALQAAAKWYQKTPADFLASEPELWIFDESLLQPSTHPVELVWRMEVTSVDNSLPLRELVLINAQRGSISLHFNQVDTAWGASGSSSSFNPALNSNKRSTDTTMLENSRLLVFSPLVNTYTANSSSALPGSFLCNQSQPNCTNGSNPHADAAHKYALGTFNLYDTKHNRNSINNSGMMIISSVHYCSPSLCPYSNANWTGSQIIYGDSGGWPLADDVVSHELTHGITQYESNLFYYYQSGAINESFSDVWGEYYDQTNGQGNDTAGVKWQIGEDVSGLGALRSMSNPPAFGDPDRMSSVNYNKGENDNGGVHTNSGINNKAVYLMVDGGTFNAKTVTALGWDKTAAIYYEAQTDLLISGADYSDLYYALQQACSNLIGQKGIVAADCVEVKDAIDAVEMNSQPAPNFNADAPLCSNSSHLPYTTFADDLETGTSNWTFTNGANARWQYDSPYGPYAQSGNHSLYADDYPGAIADANARLTSFVVPNNAYLHFAQAYGFETGIIPPDPTLHNFDGGVLEYSLNGGSSWLDAGSLIEFNGYNGSIFNGSGNPLASRSAFVGSSHGYISTRLNLASLAGQTVTFRWRMGLDASAYVWGWWVDNVKVYTCGVPNLDVFIGGALINSYYLPSGKNLANRYGVNSGPVKVSSTNSLPIFASQRAVFGNSFNSIVGYPANQLTTDYWFTSYDDVGMITYLVIGNPHPSTTALVDVYIGGIKRNGIPYSIAPGQRIYPRYGINAGPVHVVSTNNVNIFTSERTKYLNSFNEVMGYPGNQLTTDYWFTSYDDLGMITYLVIGNPHTSLTAQVDVYIGGVKKNNTPYLIAPGQRIYPRYGINAGPVFVDGINNVNIFASERSKFGQSFNEVMGYPGNQLATDYWFTSYDDTSMITYLVIGNPHTTLNAEVDVYIGGVKKNATPYVIAPGQRVFPRYAINSGPVHVVSTNGVAVFTSERSKYLNSFNEIMGLANNRLTTDYWFTSLDDVGMLTNLVIAAP